MKSVTLNIQFKDLSESKQQELQEMLDVAYAENLILKKETNEHYNSLSTNHHSNS